MNEEERKPQAQKVQNKPPKAPRAVHETIQKNLSGEFDKERSPSPAQNLNKIPPPRKKQAKLSSKLEPPKDTLKPKLSKRNKTGQSSKRIPKPIFDKNNNFNSRNPEMKRSHTRKIKPNLSPIRLDSDGLISSEGSNFDEEIEKIQKPITSLQGLFSLLGAEIEEENEDDIYVKILSQNTTVTVSKKIFEDFCTKESLKKGDIHVGPLATQEDHESEEEEEILPSPIERIDISGIFR